MATITSYATLQSVAADWLNRSDLTAVLPNFVQNAEAKLNRDRRCRRITQDDAYSITGDDLAVPTGLHNLVSMSLDGSSDQYGAVQVVAPDQIGDLKLTHGLTGVPAFVAMIRDTDGSKLFRFAPVPDQTYVAKVVFEQTVGSCVSAANWLLTDYSDIYLYAVLVESAPYLKDDARILVWKQELDERLEALAQESWDEQWSGSAVRTISPIG